MAIPANYDILAAIDILFPGVVVQRELVAAAENRLIAKNAPLDSADVTGILIVANVLGAAYDVTVAALSYPTEGVVYATTLPTYPAGLLRFPDSNPTPDGWSIVKDQKVVQGGS